MRGLAERAAREIKVNGTSVMALSFSILSSLAFFFLPDASSRSGRVAAHAADQRGQRGDRALVERCDDIRHDVLAPPMGVAKDRSPSAASEGCCAQTAGARQSHATWAELLSPDGPSQQPTLAIGNTVPCLTLMWIPNFQGHYACGGNFGRRCHISTYRARFTPRFPPPSPHM